MGGIGLWAWIARRGLELLVEICVLSCECGDTRSQLRLLRREGRSLSLDVVALLNNVRFAHAEIADERRHQADDGDQYVRVAFYEGP